MRQLDENTSKEWLKDLVNNILWNAAAIVISAAWMHVMFFNRLIERKIMVD